MSFTFGGPASASAPSFSFGAPATPAAASTSTFSFGASSTTAAAPAGGAFTFGAQPKGDQELIINGEHGH